MSTVCLSDADQMIGISEIQLGENGNTLQMLEPHCYEWKVLSVPYGYVFKPMVIYAGSQRLIFLAHKEKPAPAREKEGQIIPAVRETLMYCFMAYREAIYQGVGQWHSLAVIVLAELSFDTLPLHG